MSDENNYTIWHFLKTVPRTRLDLQGPRCHALVPTLRHRHLRARDRHRGLPGRTHLLGLRCASARSTSRGEVLLVWTTTPWTLAANVAAAVHPELTYVRAEQGRQDVLRCAGAAQSALRGEFDRHGERDGADLVGRPYRGPVRRLAGQTGRRPPSHRLGRGRRRPKAPASSTSRPAAARKTSRSRRVRSRRHCADRRVRGLYATGSDWLTGQYVHEVAVADRRRPRSARASSIAPSNTRTAIRSAGAAAPIWSSGSSTSGSSPWTTCGEPMMDVTRQITWLPELRPGARARLARATWTTG